MGVGLGSMMEEGLGLGLEERWVRMMEVKMGMMWVTVLEMTMAKMSV